MTAGLSGATGLVVIGGRIEQEYTTRSALRRREAGEGVDSTGDGP